MNLKFFSVLRKKITPFDIGVGSIIVIVGIVFFLFFYRKATFITIQVKVTDQDVLYQQTDPTTWYADRFTVGDQELDTLGRPITEITGVNTIPLDSKHHAVYLTLKVRALYDTRTKLYSTHGQNLMYGTPIQFDLSHITFEGFVTEFPGSGNTPAVHVGKATVVALVRNIEPAVASAIVPGNTIMDSDHTPLVSITSVAIEPAEKVTTTYTGNLLLQSDPLYKDVTITAEVRTETIGNDLYFLDTMPLKIGQPFPLLLQKVALDKYTIVPLITDFTEETP
jgi:hypothetical protein